MKDVQNRQINRNRRANIDNRPQSESHNAKQNRKILIIDRQNRKKNRNRRANIDIHNNIKERQNRKRNRNRRVNIDVQSHVVERTFEEKVQMLFFPFLTIYWTSV
jgi:hypothetical protein